MLTLTQFLHSKLLMTIIGFIVVIICKYGFVYVIRNRAKNKKEDKRLLINILNNLFSVLFLIYFFYLWGDEMQKFALSIAAFMMAIVIATKEFIQCVIGFIYLISSRPFRIGDWIQVGNYTGEVNELDWAKVAILEVNVDDYQYTGKTLYLPNSYLITAPIKNLNFLKRYTMHHFNVIRDSKVNPFLFINELRAKADLYCADFIDVATRYNHLIESRLGINIHGPHPTISVGTTDIGETKIMFTIFCPTEMAIEIEQKLTEDLMHCWYQEIENSRAVKCK
ncbi:mechanosensitive ion channel family protein [Psychromonas sp. Urea-02u-13]|uniref:mechanosensitive ion channel family protein n=1 Tax=Psychromonas sp. Urea-02u-13 TaxID=2058326 RepID=UPI000C3470C8|nr:mechanosensitive ion channel family protein [Psychromonas sp. Urea-02u-13]PKG39810.1 mechanosensitive ion channel family protein [Psychromonas sp. Urea-02u-13]